jgi:hypothetical protein
MFAMWVGALAILGGPGLALGVVACLKSRRDRTFWLIAAGALAGSLGGQYIAVLAPFVRRGTFSWDFLVAAVFGWHLLVPAVAAAALWAAGRALRQPALGGAVAGLFFSVPLCIAAALPLFFVVPALLGLRMEN